MYPSEPPTAPLPAPVGQWQAPWPGQPGGALPPEGGIELQQIRTGGGGTGRKLAIGALAVVVLGGGTYATAELLSDDRGSASPQEAGERLLSALNRADVLGVIDLLPPGEREVLLDISGELSEQGERLGLLDETFRLDGIPGITIEITDPEFAVDELGDGIATVSLVDGEASVEIDGDLLSGSVGEVVEAIAEANDVEVEADDADQRVDIADELDEAEEEADDFGVEFVNPFAVTVVEIDGRWYPSVGFTIAEFARADAGSSRAPNLDDGVRPDGAESPEGVVQALLDAATDLDAEAALAVLEPGEMAAIQVYSELFLGDLGDGEDSGVTAELTDAEVTSLGDGVNRVVPTGLVVEGEFDDSTLALELADGCVSLVTESGDPDVEDLDIEICEGDDLADALPDEFGDTFDDIEVPEELTDLIEAFGPVEVGIITVERDGEHFFSPLRTLFDVAAISFRGLERTDLEAGGIVFEALTGGLDDEFEEFFEELGERFVEEFFEDDFEFDDELDFDDEFDDEFDEDDFEISRVPTGPAGSGPAGELLAGDVVTGSFPLGGEVAFTLVGSAGEAFIGAQATNGADLTITISDPATGEEIDFNDDFIRFDPEVLVVLEEGQVVTVTVAAFADGDAGEFVVYYER